ncbi:MAG: hypothetical protein QOI01_222 [Mycobacterium sp.]|jgi:hypothetical protein|nr:hypothetical protein [Mycobacterium sp.]
MRRFALRARLRWQVPLAGLVAVVLLAVSGYAVLQLTTRSDPDQVNRAGRVSAGVRPDSGTHLGIPGVVDLYVPKGAVAAPVDAGLTLGGEDPLGSIPVASRRLLFQTPPIQVDLSGRQPLVPVTVTITVPAGTDARWPVLVTRHAGELKYVSGGYDAGSRRFTAQLAELSPITLVDVYQAAVKFMTGVLDVTGVAGRKPDCVGKPATLGDGSTVTVTRLTGTDTLWPCVSVGAGDQVRVDVTSVAGTFWRVTSSGGTYQGAGTVSVPDTVTQALFEVLVADRRLGEGLILPQGSGSWLVDPKDLSLTMTAKLSAGLWFAEVTAFTIGWLAEVGTGGQAGAAIDALQKLSDKGSWLECLSKAAQAANDGLVVSSQSIVDVSKAAFTCAGVLTRAITGAELKGLPALLVTIFESGIATIWGAVEVSARNFLSIWRPSLTQFGWRITRGQPASSSGGIAPFVGEWHVHGEKLVINADRSGTDLWNAGPCGDNLCTGYSSIRFTVVGDTLVGTVTSVLYRQNPGGTIRTDPDLVANGPQVKDELRLRVADTAVLKVVGDRQTLGNPYFCGAAASAAWHYKCNA